MSFSDDIKIIVLGSMGSEVATLIGRYQREGVQEISLSEEDKDILKKAIRFVKNTKDGYDQVVEVRNFNMNSEVPVSYNYYLRVRQQLPELGSVNKASEIGEEIEMFAEILKKLNDGKPISQIEVQGLENVGKFFSRLSDFALEELYIINEKTQLESI